MIFATPPAFHRPVAAWLTVGIALVLPWIWLIVLDRLLRRTR